MGGVVCARHHMLENDNEKEMTTPARLWCALHPQGKSRPLHKDGMGCAGEGVRELSGEAQSGCSFREHVHANTHARTRCVG